VLGSSVLMAVMRWHRGKVESLRAEQLKRSEAALRASQERIQALVGASRDLIMVLDARGARQASYGAVEEITGYDPSERGPYAHFESVHPDDLARVQREFAELLKRPGETVRAEWRYKYKDGGYRWEEGLATNRLGQEGIDGIVVNIRDVSDRKAAEQAIARNEQRYRTLFETVTDAIFLLARDERIIEVNDAACRMLGYTRDELLSMRMGDITPEEKRKHVEEVNRMLAEKGHLIFTATNRRKDGTIFPVEVAASLTELDGVSAFMGVSRDITERVRAEVEKRQLQDQLQHAVKMESVGRLAGGVAHDFNNLLTAILGNVDLAIFRLGKGGDVRDSLAEIRGAALIAATVTRQLLAFSRKHVVESRPADVNDLVRNMLSILERLIGEDVHLRTIAGQGLGTVCVDPGLIEQAIVNLAVNARDAMPRGGDLVIETADVTFDEKQAHAHSLGAAGRHVLISITDTGTGMSDEVKGHLFEPFFTTKSPSKGSGLGLATTYSAVEQSGGSIEAFSELGKGTTFKIYLPVVAAAEEAVPKPPALDAGALPGGKESILVVEDDVRVREMAISSLRACGYEVLAAANGEDALALGVARKSPIHMLLTDVVMPGMNGREISQMLTKIHPETRTLFSSGYSENIITRHGSLEAGIDFLSKPYTMDALARRVREILDRT
jgi:PAS domain S-box-containing protein